MKYLVFEIKEIETLLEFAKGEVLRYTDMKPFGNANDLGCMLMKSKWQGKVDTFEEMLKFGAIWEE
jgi:hypothetical protein